MKTVNVIEGKKLIEENFENDNFQVIDVRSQMEYNSGHIPGSRLLPLDEINQWYDDLDKDKTYLFVCRSGGRSSMACQFLQNNGYTNVINLMGGMIDWIEEGYDVEK